MGTGRRVSPQWCQVSVTLCSAMLISIFCNAHFPFIVCHDFRKISGDFVAVSTGVGPMFCVSIFADFFFALAFVVFFGASIVADIWVALAFIAFLACLFGAFADFVAVEAAFFAFIDCIAGIAVAARVRGSG